MRRSLLVVAAIVALAIPAAAIAADLNPGNLNSDCKSAGLVKWHFVNNQTGGATVGTLTAYFETGGTDTNGADPGDITLTDNEPDKVLNSVLHFSVYTSGYANLVGANTGSVPGRLVLSDWCKK